MARLPLSTLPAFQAAARRANLRSAAEVLHLTHGAVSQQIRVLETQLGFPVFERRGRRIVLNAAGKALLASVDAALAALDDGVNAAAAAASGAAQTLRVTVLPSFAQRWLLPRIGRWRERHPGIALEVDASQKIVDLQREGFHAAIRVGRGQWPGLVSEPLVDSPVIAVGAPAAARRLAGRGDAALAEEPLIGDVPLWESWFAAAGLKLNVRPVADFNDGSLMLQAAEHGLGITLAREMFAADALADGRLVRLSPVSVEIPGARGYWFVHPPALADWPPLQALRRWLRDELEASQRQVERLRRAARNAASGAQARSAATETTARTPPRRPAKGRTAAAPAAKRAVARRRK